MTPGLAFFYGGFVRSRNILNTLMMSFVLMAIVGVTWVLWGYSLSFTFYWGFTVVWSKWCRFGNNRISSRFSTTGSSFLRINNTPSSIHDLSVHVCNYYSSLNFWGDRRKDEFSGLLSICAAVVDLYLHTSSSCGMGQRWIFRFIRMDYYVAILGNYSSN